eukprot:1161040-Pelagomonas_calceolata.AAC.5
MDEGISCSALREVKLLRELQQGGDSSAGGGSADGCHASPGASPHVIQLLDVFCHKQKLLMVFECMETDLGNVIRWGTGPSSMSGTDCRIRRALILRTEVTVPA